MLGDAYHVDRELPPGGMSRLFLATERSLDRQVVIKVLPPELASDVSATRFQREISVAAHLQHPHILGVLSAGSKDGLLYYITPYVPGESLRHRLAREGQLPIADCVRILTETADAVARAHRDGVVHRDIKPENILLQDGHPLLADFGVARAIQEASTGQRLTATGMAPGTPAYMAPEQLAGEQHVDGRSDVYALAVVGYEMLTGVSPFGGATPQAIAAAHFTTPPRPLTQLRRDVPRTVSEAIHWALDREPEARFATAAEFRDALAPQGRSIAGRRIGVWTAAIVGGLAAVLVVALAVRSRRSGGASIDDNLIAVTPFTVLDPLLAIWREGMVDILSHNLDGAGPLRTVAPTVVVHCDQDGLAPVNLARGLGAGIVITGSIERSGVDSVRVTANLVDGRSGRPRDEVEYRGSAAHMDWITDSVTVALLRSIARTQAVGVARGSLAGARSLPALKALLESEQAFRQGAWDSAESAAERAIQIDSTFALAYYWAGFARGWSHNAGDALSVAYLHRALALNHGLTPRDSFLIATDPTNLEGSLPALRAALANGTTIAQRFPDDPQIWNNLGEIRYHLGFGPEFGVTDRSALDPFARAIALDSNFAPAYVHATELSLKVLGRDSGLRYARRYVRFNPPANEMAAMRLVVALLGNPRDTASPHRLADSASPAAIFEAGGMLIAVPDSAESAAKLGSWLIQRLGAATPMGGPNGPPAAVPWFNSMMYRGHIRAVWRMLTQFPAADTAAPLASLAMLADLGIIPAAHLDSSLRQSTHLRDGWSWFGLRWWASRSDTADLQRFLKVRGARVGTSIEDEPLHPAAYDTAVTRAYLALARHDTADAIRRFKTLPDSLCAGTCLPDALTRAELLMTHGQSAAADSLLNRRYQSLYLAVVDVFRVLTLARAADRSGDRQTAQEAYERIVATWSTADPELQPVVTEARTRLARLGGDH